jgi:LysM repeat protein
VTIVHVVQPGQNLFRIALRYRTTINAIARLNGITNTRLIRVGQRLRVRTCLRGQSDHAPAAMGAAYTVRPDDTLSRIALRHGVSVAQIMTVNGLRAPFIVAGQILIIA